MEDNHYCESIPYSWAKLMKKEVLDEAQGIQCEICSLRKETNIFPPVGTVYRSLELTDPSDVRVVILGQDPYPTIGVANGLAFSVNPGIKIPASLRNIFKELCSDLGCAQPISGDLTKWAERGVLLLNTVLTVEEGQPASHSKKGWQVITGEVLRICMTSANPTVFILWGQHAIKAAQKYGVSETDTKKILCSSHPSPLGAAKGNASVPAFVGSRPFSRANVFLKEMGSEPVNWELM